MRISTPKSLDSFLVRANISEPEIAQRRVCVSSPLAIIGVAHDELVLLGVSHAECCHQLVGRLRECVVEVIRRQHLRAENHSAPLDLYAGAHVEEKKGLGGRVAETKPVEHLLRVVSFQGCRGGGIGDAAPEVRRCDETRTRGKSGHVTSGQLFVLKK